MKHIYAFRNHLVKDNTDFSVTQNCFYFHLEMLRCKQSEWNQIKSKSVDALTICWLRNITFSFFKDLSTIKKKIIQIMKILQKLKKKKKLNFKSGKSPSLFEISSFWKYKSIVFVLQIIFHSRFSGTIERKWCVV